MSRVEIVTKEGNLLGVVDDDKNTVEQTEEWHRIQDEARKRKAAKKGGGGKKPPMKGKNPWSTGY